MIAGRHNPLGRKGLPYAFRVEYLESTGTQWIDTGVVLGSKWTVKAKFAITSSRSCVVCGRYNNEGYQRSYMIYLSSCKFYRVNSTNWEVINGSPTLTVRTLVEATAKNDDTYTIECNGTTLSSGKIQNSRLSTTLFADVYNRGQENEVVYDRGYVMLAWIQLYDGDGVLRFDGIPVIDRDGTPCMYDRVSGELFYNQGSGAFTAGPRVVDGGGYSKCLKPRYYGLLLRSAPSLWRAAA